jgi:N-acetyl sugar amidotransferase
MRYCKKCLQPDTRPHIAFDNNQVCFACRYEELKKDIDWGERKDELREIAITAIEKHAPYDCVIGISGGKDSTFQALYAKEKLKMKVLLVNGAPDGITEIGRKNLENLVSKGFDMISLRPNPIIAKQLAKRAFIKEGNMVGPSEYALWASAYMIADKFDIPLIIQGENTALTLGTVSKMKKDGDAFGVVDLNTLKGGGLETLVNYDISENDLYMYNLSCVNNCKQKGIKAIWLQYYAKEWSQVNNADFSVARGLTGRTDDLKNIGRYRRYTALDGDVQIVNQMLKYLKLGFGFATDEACYDIREGRLTREDAIWYVEEYDGKCGDKYVLEFCDYIGIGWSEFWDITDKFVNRKLFERVGEGKYRPKFKVGTDFNV